jgi:hypothetical protein
MTREDDEFLTKYNDALATPNRLSEDNFEAIMDVFESTASEQTPYASVDNTVVAYEHMVSTLAILNSPVIMQHAQAIYDYWCSRRKEVGNRPLHSTLKFEVHQETDESDPYVCFRRREARQTRKTRARDVQMTEKLKRLRRELEDGRQLVIDTFERETLKRAYLNMDRDVFEQRARLKEMKVRLGIKTEDEDLYNHKVRARRLRPVVRFCGANPVRLCSLRSVKRPNRLRHRGSSCGCLHGPIRAPSNPTLSCSRTSWRRRRTCSNKRSRGWRSPTRCRTKTMSICRSRHSRRCGNRLPSASLGLLCHQSI